MSETRLLAESMGGDQSAPGSTVLGPQTVKPLDTNCGFRTSLGAGRASPIPAHGWPRRHYAVANPPGWVAVSEVVSAAARRVRPRPQGALRGPPAAPGSRRSVRRDEA
jgi:hypothetical protein